MFSDLHNMRLSAEENNVGQFIASHPRIRMAAKNGIPARFYIFTFLNIKTTIVKPDELLLTAPPSLRVAAVQLTVVINISADYPRQKPDIALFSIHDIEHGEFRIYNTHVFDSFVCLYSDWRVSNSIVDALCRLWNVLGYNHHINLDRTDVLNPAALDWYKNSLSDKTISFPLDEAIINIMKAPESEKKVFTFTDM